MVNRARHYEIVVPRFRTHSRNQKMTVAAMQMAEKQVWAQRSYRVAMRRQSFRRPKVFSMRWGWRYKVLSYSITVLRFLRGGMQGAMPLAASAARKPSLS